jgi:hypothetical protein
MIEDQTEEKIKLKKIKLKRLPRNLISRNGKRHLTPSDDFKEGKAMSYQIAVSLAAAAIGISCIATEASARGGGGGGGASRGGARPEAVGFGAGAGTRGVGAPVAAPSYAVPLYNAKPACGFYPYPRCRKP